jgi:hypothetical protein
MLTLDFAGPDLLLVRYLHRWQREYLIIIV